MNTLLDRAEARCREVFAHIDHVEQLNTARVLAALQANRVGAQHFAGSSGYGYGDMGRDTLEKVFAHAFGCEEALVRPQIVSGTHALAICLFGLLRPGDHLLAAAGKPYDTLDEVIGIAGESDASLKQHGVTYGQVELQQDGRLDLPSILAALRPETRVVLIQRSRGYAWRPSLGQADLAAACQAIHEARPNVFVMVDNCYGEFVCDQEPCSMGADIMVGSLIKNAGGGIAPTGGYLAGTAKAIARVESRLTSPGIGREVGSYAPGYQLFYQGFFMAPHVVAQAMKTAVLFASAFDLMGYTVHPVYDDRARTDIIQAIRLDEASKLIAFCRAIQAASPVDSFAAPEPWDMPGYQHPVIMAAGTFISGASIELSADAPVKPPYNVYLQGGLTYAHGKLALARVLEAL